MSIVVWMRRLGQAVYFNFPATNLRIDMTNPKTEMTKLKQLTGEINVIKRINISLGLISGITGLVIAVGALLEIYSQIPGVFHGDFEFPFGKLLLPLPFVIIGLVFTLNLKHITGVLLELNRLHLMIVVVNLLDKSGTTLEQRDGMHVMIWRADNGEEIVLGADQVKTDAMAKAAKTVIAMIESLTPDNFLQYIRINPKEEDPRKHLEKLFALHAAQKASREGRP